MRYDNYFSAHINQRTAGLGISLSFGDPLLDEENNPFGEFWGITVSILIFDLQWGILTR